MHPNCKMETTVELSAIHMVSIAVHKSGKGINQQPATDYAETGRGSGVCVWDLPVISRAMCNLEVISDQEW